MLMALFVSIVPIAKAGDPTGKPTVEEIRTHLESAHERDGSGPFGALLPYLADEIETVHEPAFPGDGMIEGAKLAKSLPLEHKLQDAAIRNRRMNVSFEAISDSIVMKGVMTGTLPDGRSLVHPVHVIYTIAQGRIIRIWVDASTEEIQEGYRLQREAFMSPQARPILEKMLEAMGVEMEVE